MLVLLLVLCKQLSESLFLQVLQFTIHYERATVHVLFLLNDIESHIVMQSVKKFHMFLLSELNFIYLLVGCKSCHAVYLMF